MADPAQHFQGVAGVLPGSDLYLHVSEPERERDQIGGRELIQDEYGANELGGELGLPESIFGAIKRWR